MTPERWQQIDNLLQEALEQPVEEFEARLNRACARDESLREEVVSLIKHRELAESFLEVPAFQAAAELLSEHRSGALIGTRVGPYTIEAQLGVGGMGEVYLAADEKLDRKVAIKFLPLYLEADGVSRKRLIREARAAAKLDHPNICSIYEIAEEDDRSYIVMQYVEGETLGARLERQPLGLRESSDIAYQVADALAEAHCAGDYSSRHKAAKRDDYSARSGQGAGLRTWRSALMLKGETRPIWRQRRSCRLPV